MNHNLRAIQLICAATLSTVVLSAKAEVVEAQENNPVSSSQEFQAERLKTDENVVIQENSQMFLKAALEREYTFDAAQFTRPKFDVAQATETAVEQPFVEFVLTDDIETTQPVVEQPPTKPVSAEPTTELPQFETSAALLAPAEPTNPALIAQDIPPEEDVFPTPAEAVPEEGEIDPGRRTRSGPSYVGIGGNFGTVGDSSVGDSGLIIYSKIGLTRFFSVRPAIATDFDEDATFLLPATLDVAPIRINNDIRLAPYIGGGAALSTQGDFGPLVVGGVDLPVTSNLTATAGVNFAILDPVDLGVFVGIGYNFSGF
ncbi:hypothetical protein C1752_07495 [Acaryochloris thomasi RCC1774]|uniref:Outer membrane protein beta-barrel domain-containing protein n=1 Tax=Acaryochloris thomasi RCC1774 TaxID=1764569 RepID=A0A2W1JAQ7_9CYAN|nr:hypothetical protein [Acaryochloris thomasi]PZD71219.1 hypothetical protein C1752_07495 [Acaryochloris thomasi RCC1774]